MSLLALGRHLGALVFRELSAESTGLLHSEVLGRVLLSLDAQASGGAALLRDDSEDLGNGLSHLLQWELATRLLTRILESFTWGWEETLDTLRAASSF